MDPYENQGAKPKAPTQQSPITQNSDANNAEEQMSVETNVPPVDDMTDLLEEKSKEDKEEVTPSKSRKDKGNNFMGMKKGFLLDGFGSEKPKIISQSKTTKSPPKPNDEDTPVIKPKQGEQEKFKIKKGQDAVKKRAPPLQNSNIPPLHDMPDLLEQVNQIPNSQKRTMCPIQTSSTPLSSLEKSSFTTNKIGKASDGYCMKESSEDKEEVTSNKSRKDKGNNFMGMKKGFLLDEFGSEKSKIISKSKTRKSPPNPRLEDISVIKPKQGEQEKYKIQEAQDAMMKMTPFLQNSDIGKTDQNEEKMTGIIKGDHVDKSTKNLVVTLASPGNCKPAYDRFGTNMRLQNTFDDNQPVDSAGNKPTLTIPDAIKKWLSFNFQNLSSEAHYWPPIYEFKHPGEPTDIIDEKGNDEIKVPLEDFNYDTLKPIRKGEKAEKQTLHKLFLMFSEHRIASFIIHGYQWDAQYLKTLMDENRLKKRMKKQNQQMRGETDFLISLPGRFIMAIEVKAVNPNDSNDSVGYITQSRDDKIISDVKKAFKQCDRTANCVNNMNIFHINSNVKMLKVAALPNCGRRVVSRLFPDDYNAHIMTEDDLKSSDALHDWLMRISNLHKYDLVDSHYDISMHTDLIGLLIGPASFVKIRSIPQAVRQTVEHNEKFGSEERILERWCQLNRQQLATLDCGPRFLFVTGTPGSGKSLLGLLKAKQIIADDKLQNESSALFFFVQTISPRLLDHYKQELSNLGSDSVQVFVLQNSAEASFPMFVKGLQHDHKGKRIHIIIDESEMRNNEGIGKKGSPWYHIKNFEQDWNRNVDKTRLGYVWIFENYNCTDRVKLGKLPLFYNMHLEKIMRMSMQNVELINFLSDCHFSAGHAVAGPSAVVYKLNCICPDSCNGSHCYMCHPVRVAFLVEHAICTSHISKDDFKLSVVLSTALTYYTDLLEELDLPFPCEVGANGSVFPIGFYRGCENSFVFIDMNEFHIEQFAGGREALTRSLGMNVFLAAGCCHPGCEQMYEEQILKLEKASHRGFLKIVNVDPADHESKLKHLLNKHLSRPNPLRVSHTAICESKILELFNNFRAEEFKVELVGYVKHEILLEECRRSKNLEGIKFAEYYLSMHTHWVPKINIYLRLPMKEVEIVRSAVTPGISPGQECDVPVCSNDPSSVNSDIWRPYTSDEGEQPVCFENPETIYTEIKIFAKLVLERKFLGVRSAVVRDKYVSLLNDTNYILDKLKDAKYDRYTRVIKTVKEHLESSLVQF